MPINSAPTVLKLYSAGRPCVGVARTGTLPCLESAQSTSNLPNRLRAQSPDLANKLQEISRALESAGSRQTSAIFFIGEEEDHITHEMTLENEAIEHIKFANDRMQVLKETRNIQEFRDFLRPRQAANVVAEIP